MNTCSKLRFKHSHAGTELLVSIKGFSFNNNNKNNNSNNNFHPSTIFGRGFKKNSHVLQNKVNVLIFLKRDLVGSH
jgi:hypothetical protein